MLKKYSYACHTGMEIISVLRNLYTLNHKLPPLYIYNGVLDKTSDHTPRYEGPYNQIQTFIFSNNNVTIKSIISESEN